MAQTESLDIHQFEKSLWKAFDELKVELGYEDFPVLLYLLVLRRDNPEIFNKSVTESYFSPSLRDIIRHQFELISSEQMDVAIEFENVLEKLSRRSIAIIMETFRQIDSLWLIENCGSLFDLILNRIIRAQGALTSQHWLPVELSEFIWGILDLQNIRSIYNPFSGLCSFGLSKNQNQVFVGQEINRRVWAIGYLRMIAHNKLENSHILLGDSIGNWNPYSNSFDLIISAPPFGLKVEPFQSNLFNFGYSADFFLVEMGIQDLTRTGKLVAVVPQSFLFKSGPSNEFRKFVVEQDYLESVVLFPGGLLHATGVSIAIVILTKRKEQPGKFRFVDASSYFQTGPGKVKKLKSADLVDLYLEGRESNAQTFVDSATIRSLDYNFVVSRYFLRNDLEFCLKDFGSIIPGTRKKTDSVYGKFVRIRDLKDDRLVHQLDQGDIPNIDIPAQSHKIVQTCILLATRWNTLKPTLFEFKGEPIYISGDLVAYIPDEERVLPHFLINELHEGYVLKQLEALRLGSIQPYLRREDLLKIQINLPSLEEQRKLIQNFYEKAALEKERITQKEIEETTAAAAEQNNFLRHSIAGLASNVKGSIAAIQRIVNEQISPDHPEILELKVTPGSRLTFSNYLEILERDIKEISDTVARDLRIDDEVFSKELEPMEIIGYLESFVNEVVESHSYDCKIEFSLDEEAFKDEDGNRISTFVLANQELLNKLLHNLIENAVAHAFTPGEKNRIEIFLMSTESEEKKDGVQILFSNTGRPFPEDYSLENFARKGSSTGNNAGTGFGGWFINQIVKKLGGSLDIIDETGPEGLPDTDLATSIEISLPIVETISINEL